MNKESYPYFARTYPNDDLSARLVVVLLSTFGWRNVAVLHVRPLHIQTVDGRWMGGSF